MFGFTRGEFNRYYFCFMNINRVSLDEQIVGLVSMLGVELLSRSRVNGIHHSLVLALIIASKSVLLDVEDLGLEIE